MRWAAAAGLNLLAGNIVSGEDTDDFVTVQLAHIDEYRAVAGRPGRGAAGRVTDPLDSADRATRQRYLAYAGSRRGRTLRPHGERRTASAARCSPPT